jgi:hypothetical protein
MQSNKSFRRQKQKCIHKAMVSVHGNMDTLGNCLVHGNTIPSLFFTRIPREEN